MLNIEYISKGIILNTRQLYSLRKKVKSIKIVSNIFINAVILGYKKNILDNNLKKYIMDYKRLLKQYKSRNLDEYIQTYEKVMDLAI